MAKYWLIKGSRKETEIGCLFQVKEDEIMVNVLRDKLKYNCPRNLIELTDSEYKYYEKLDKTKRIKKYEKGILKEICKLVPGDRCRIEINGEYLKVTILKKEISHDDIHFTCKQENGNNCEILGSSIDGIVKMGQDLPNAIVDPKGSIIELDMMDQIETLNDIWAVNPRSVFMTKGKHVEEKYIIFNSNGKQHWTLLKWKGIINNKINCIGCDIKVKSRLGTNGTFNDKSLFKCDEGCGVLIPMNEIENCCVIDGHKQLKSTDGRIDEKTICCMKIRVKSHLNNRIIIEERIKKVNSKENGIYKWVGLVNKTEVIGLDSKNLIKDGTDGTFCGIKLFTCNPKCGALFESTCFESEFKRIVDLDVNIIDPMNVKLIENGEKIRKLMHLNTKTGKIVIHIKWRGIIDGYLCVGCEMQNEFEYGTNGMFAGRILFECRAGTGMLIPVDELTEGCELKNHANFIKYRKSKKRVSTGLKNIDCHNVCCAEWLTNLKRWPQLQVGSRIKSLTQELRGTCKWIGLVNGKEAVGVEMDSNCKGTNGQFSSLELFSCPNNKGVLFFVEDIIHDVDSENLHFIVDKIVDTNQIFYVKPMNNINNNTKMLGTPVMIQMNTRNYIGEVKWMGMINNEVCVGLDMEDRFDYGSDGIIRDDARFDCMRKHGLITPLKNIELYDDAHKPPLLLDDLINPSKYLKCEENWNLELMKQKNIKKDNLVFVILKSGNSKTKLKGTLRWWGFINQMQIAAVELAEDHEYGTNGLFWRYQLFNCPDKRAVAVSFSSVYQYAPYQQKAISNEDRTFTEIDINSAVKYNDGMRELFGTVTWTGVDENGKYFYGLELDGRVPNGTDGQFNGQRLFQCRPGYGILAPFERITKNTNCMQEMEVISQYFLELMKSSNNPDLEIRIVKDFIRMKNERFIKSLLECHDHPLDLAVHEYLIPLLIDEENINLIKLLLNCCDLTPVASETFLNLANLALKTGDEDLFAQAIENCEDKNTLLGNGETFVTNLFKANRSEEFILDIIKKNIFDLQVINKNGESSFTLACQMAMASVVEKLIPRSLSSRQKQEATHFILEANEKLAQLGESLDGTWKIFRLINNVDTRQSIECNICMNREINLALECGHVCCDVCSQQIFKCPFCDRDTGTVRRIYLP